MPAEAGLPAGRAPGRGRVRPAGLPGRRWRSSLRLRYAITATLFAGVTFAVGGSAALTLYHDSLAGNVDHSVLGAAEAVAAAAGRGRLPDPIPMPVGAGVPRIQVVGRGSRVVSGDPASAREPPMLALTRNPGGRVVSVAHPAGLPDRRAAVVALRVSGPAGPLTIIAAGSLDTADSRADQAAGLSAVLGVISLAVVAAVAWLTAGRTLSRVERLRTQVAAITACGDLHQRVPQAGRDELAQLGSTLNEMLAAMADSADRQRRFVADAAHELRTPLAGLRASLEVAASHPGTIQDGPWLTELAEGHRRLGHLLNDLLVLAGLDGSAPIHRETVDLAGVVTDCTRRPTPDGVELRASRIGHTLVCGDESQLGRVVTNLIDNALRYARHTVEVSLSAEAGQAVLAVTDDGPGIAAADRQRIWERFVRLADDRSRASGGTGLGLALVKELVEAHGGTVSVTDTAGGSGAHFLVRLPLRAAGPGAH